MNTDEELLKLIDDALPTDADRAAQIRHQNERDGATIALLEKQLRTGEYFLVGLGPVTREEIVAEIAGYRARIARRGR